MISIFTHALDRICVLLGPIKIRTIVVNMSLDMLLRNSFLGSTSIGKCRPRIYYLQTGLRIIIS